jgi:hypothetical protein
MVVPVDVGLGLCMSIFCRSFVDMGATDKVYRASSRPARR